MKALVAPLAALLLAAAAAVASAQVAAPGPQKDPQHPKDDLHYLGDVALLDVVASNGGATLFADRGAGTRTDPRRYYLLWKTDRAEEPAHPLLVFVEPSDGAHAGFPKGGFYLASKPLKTFPGAKEYRGRPFQVWVYPDHPGAKGLFAAVSAFDAKGKPRHATPVLWWGLSRGPDLERLRGEELRKVYRELGAR